MSEYLKYANTTHIEINFLKKCVIKPITIKQ